MPDVANVGPSAQSIPVPNNEWPPDVLYIHLLAKIEDLKASLGDLRTADLLALQAAFAAAEKAVDTALIAQEKAVHAALAAQEKAADKYEREVKEWRSNSNEWRDAMDDREKRFLSINAYDAAHSPLVQDVTDLKLSRERDRGRQAAQTAIIGFLFAAVTLALRFIG